MDRRSSWARVFSKPAVSRNFNEPLSTRNAAARSHRPSLMKLRIPTPRHPPDEEEHAEQQLLAVRRPAEAQVQAQRLVPQDPEEERRVAAVQVAHLLRPLTPVPLSFSQCDSKSTEARSVKSKRS